MGRAHSQMRSRNCGGNRGLSPGTIAALLMTAGDRLNRTSSCPRCQIGSMRYPSNTPERDRPRSAAMKSECRAAFPERSRSWSNEIHQPVDICRPRACEWSPATIRDRDEHPPGHGQPPRAAPLPSRPLTRAHPRADTGRQRPPRLRSCRRSSVITRRTIRAPRSGQEPTPFQESSPSPCTEPRWEWMPRSSCCANRPTRPVTG